MSAAPFAPQQLTYRPALAWFAALGSTWVFVLVTLGAFTTSIGAGMAFEDWPLSNGSINPEGWLNDIMMFAEHSHRLTGAIMGLITVALAIWVGRTESRGWLRKLAWWAVAIVIIQGLIGGKRVLLDSLAVPGFEMTLGQMLRIPHGILAHLYVCILFAIAAALSRRWIESKPQVEPTEPRLRQFSRLATFLIVVQLVIAASMRHNNAGMAIPVFPHSTVEGGWLPESWDYRVTLAFAHRVMAVVLTGVLGWLVIAVWRDRASSVGLKNLSLVVIALLAVQIALGASVIWTGRNPHYTTAHVTVGACVLATTFLLTWWLHRGIIAGEVESRFGEPSRKLAAQAARS
jgi:cytochrome c oxidase assembly protein subunit 15